MSEEKRARRIYVSGQVQGVGYRYFARNAAAKVGVTGYVRNLPDGRVEAFAVGTPAQLENFIAELRRGPFFAMVERIELEDADPLLEFASGFTIEPRD